MSYASYVNLFFKLVLIYNLKYFKVLVYFMLFQIYRLRYALVSRECITITFPLLL